jgi:hypothetical protein
VRSLLEQTNLWDARGRRLGTFSGGMRQRFGIAVALIGNPRLIIVDEPTAGLDPAERARFLNLLSELGENAVVILSTHIVEDVSDLCQRMAIIRQGEILLEAEPQAAVRAVRGRVWRREVAREELKAFEAAHVVISTTLVGGRTVVHVHGDAPPDDSFQPVEPDLKDVYFTVMRGIGIHRPTPVMVTLDRETTRREDDARANDSVRDGDDARQYGSVRDGDAARFVDSAPPPGYPARPASAEDDASPPDDPPPPLPPVHADAPPAPRVDAAPPVRDDLPPQPDDASRDNAPAKEEDPWARFRRPGSSA